MALSLIMAMTLWSCRPTSKQAGAFNDRLMEQQKAVVLKYDKLLETFDTYVPEKMDAALLALSSQIADSKDEVSRVETMEGGENLKNEVLNYLSVLDNAASTDFEHLVRLYKMPENEFTPKIRIEWETRYKEVDSRIKEAAARLKEVQAAYAEDFNLKIK
jgi:hypothetical protein